MDTAQAEMTHSLKTSALKFLQVIKPEIKDIKPEIKDIQVFQNDRSFPLVKMKMTH
jgi:hypothetical protein